jgi:hypothetical protein
MHRHFGENRGVRTTAVAPWLLLLVVIGAWTGLAAGASAQDAGAPPTAGDGSGDGSPDGVGGSLCSCETLDESDGLLHLCTDSYEREVCEQFSCARGSERARACPSRGVQLCCEMPKQGTQSRLYDDCTHPNCESGFRDQCGDFHGTVHEGDCDVSATPSSPKKNPLCTVARPGAHGNALPWALACVSAVAFSLRRRRAR